MRLRIAVMTPDAAPVGAPVRIDDPLTRGHVVAAIACVCRVLQEPIEVSRQIIGSIEVDRFTRREQPAHVPCTIDEIVQGGAVPPLGQSPAQRVPRPVAERANPLVVAPRQLDTGLGEETVGRRDLDGGRGRHVGTHGTGYVLDEGGGQIDIGSHLDLHVLHRRHIVEAQVGGRIGATADVDGSPQEEDEHQESGGSAIGSCRFVHDSLLVKACISLSRLGTRRGRGGKGHIVAAPHVGVGPHVDRFAPGPHVVPTGERALLGCRQRPGGDGRSGLATPLATPEDE